MATRPALSRVTRASVRPERPGVSPRAFFSGEDHTHRGGVDGVLGQTPALIAATKFWSSAGK
jgi:hypothetical protein